jgi:tape measure domain-containing protein
MADDSKTLELQIRIAAQEAVRAVASLKGEIQTLAGEAKKCAGTDGAALEKSFKDAGAAAKDSVTSIGDIKKTVMSLAEVVAATKALSFIKDMGTFALKTADDFQTMKNQFGILLGDMEAGAGLFNEIKAFNDKTPFDMSTLTQATNVLIAAKVPLQDLQDQLTKFGDLSQGNSQKMTSYVNAFSQAAAKGKADMQVLNTYIHQGVPILDTLAKNFGKTTAEIVEMSSEGKISFADFSKALDDLTAAGGQYFGGMELASKSLAAMQEGLKEATNSLAASFGDMLLPIAIAVVGALTEITNAINESPILKGLLVGALVAITGYLGAMAVKAGIAFAQQMALNFAVGAMNPVVLASTIAVAALAAGYTVMAMNSQKTARETENQALAQRNLNDAMREGRTAVQEYYRQSQNFDLTTTLNQLRELREEINRRGRHSAFDEINNYRSAIDRFKVLRDSFIKENYDATTDDKIKELQKRIEDASKLLRNVDIPGVVIDISYEDNGKLRQIISDAQKEIDKLSGADEKRHALEEIAREEARIQRELTKTKIDNLEYEREEALRIIKELETKKLSSAAYTEEEIADIRKRFAEMSENTILKFKIEIDKTELDEARDAIKNWQEELSDSLLIGIMNLKIFSDEAAVIISDLTAQLIELSSSAALSGFEEFGRALGEGEDAAESMSRALSAMAKQILDQLPTMFLQAGLQLIANGQWAMGLGFIAAAGSTAFIKGYVDGETQKASKHAQGGVFDEYGQAARMFADGGAFTNQIVSSPTYFAHGGGLGLMGEAGPEAIMPLTRMPNGDLGVQTAGGGTNVIVNIINNSGAEVRQEETETAGGGKQIDVIIGDMVNSHIASGKADRVMGGRFGLRAAGV